MIQYLLYSANLSSSIEAEHIEDIDFSTDDMTYMIFALSRGLSYIVFPENFTCFGTVTGNSSNIQWVELKATTPPTMTGPYDLGSSGPIYVPDSAVNAYKAATNWSSYASRIFGVSEKP